MTRSSMLYGLSSPRFRRDIQVGIAYCGLSSARSSLRLTLPGVEKRVRPRLNGLGQSSGLSRKLLSNRFDRATPALSKKLSEGKIQIDSLTLSMVSKREACALL